MVFQKEQSNLIWDNVQRAHAIFNMQSKSLMYMKEVTLKLDYLFIHPLYH